MLYDTLYVRRMVTLLRFISLFESGVCLVGRRTSRYKDTGGLKRTASMLVRLELRVYGKRKEPGSEPKSSGRDQLVMSFV
jgi:hypothetical protein